MGISRWMDSTLGRKAVITSRPLFLSSLFLISDGFSDTQISLEWFSARLGLGFV